MTVIVRESLPAVVTVVVLDKDGEELRRGSGFFISPDALLVTNEHVVRDGHSFLFKRRDGSFFVGDRIVGVDVARDLAVLQASAENVAHLEIADRSEPELGEDVIAIGSPLALDATVSTGIVSGFRDLGDGIRLIQTTAPMSPGSSGGPLLDREGRVIGVTVLFLEGGQNLNFAVPADLIPQLLQARQPPAAKETETAPLLPDLTTRGWLSLTAAKDVFQLRQAGYYLYTERQFPSGTPEEVYERCELKHDQGRWKGTCGVGSYVPCEGALKYCVFQFGIQVHLITLDRIEGSAEFIDRFVCKTCTTTGSVWKPFVWIPKLSEAE